LNQGEKEGKGKPSRSKKSGMKEERQGGDKKEKLGTGDPSNRLGVGQGGRGWDKSGGGG